MFPGGAPIPAIHRWQNLEASNIDLSLEALQELGVDIALRFEILSVEEPPKRVPGVRVASVAELFDKLRNEAKVIWCR